MALKFKGEPVNFPKRAGARSWLPLAFVDGKWYGAGRVKPHPGPNWTPPRDELPFYGGRVACGKTPATDRPELPGCYCRSFHLAVAEAIALARAAEEKRRGAA